MPESSEALKKMKYEIAAELGLTNEVITQDGGDTEFASELGGTESHRHQHVQWSKIATRDAVRWRAYHSTISSTRRTSAERSVKESSIAIDTKRQFRYHTVLESCHGPFPPRKRFIFWN